MKTRIVVAVLVVLIGLFAALQWWLPQTAAQTIAAEVETSTGYDNVGVSVKAFPAWSLLGGKADGITIKISALRDMVLPLEQLTLDWQNVDLNRFWQERCVFEAQWDATSLNSLFSNDLGPVQDMIADVKDGVIEIQGNLTLYGNAQAVTLRLKPSFDEAGAFVLQLVDMTAGDEDLKTFLGDKIEDIFTFQLQANFLPGTLRVTGTEWQNNGQLKVWGEYVPDTNTTTK